jgi:hypothetical protein
MSKLETQSTIRRSSIEIIIAIFAALNCLIVPLLFSYSTITQVGENIITLWPLPGLYFFEIIIIGVLGLVAVLKSTSQLSLLWSAIPWICSGILFAFVILGAWTIGFALIPAMISFLLLGILIDRRLKGDSALHLIYFVSAGIAQAVLVFILV